MKLGDIVLNKRTNMIGAVAAIDASCDQARLEHEERTHWTKFSDLEPYTGSQQPGEELKAAKEAREAADAPQHEDAPTHEGEPKAVH